MFRLGKAGTERQLAPRKLTGAPTIVFYLITKQEAPDLQTQIADKWNTQAVLQLSSEWSTHQPHRCSTRDQRYITDNLAIKSDARGLVKTFWATADRKRYQDGKGAGLVSPPLAGS